ncbi:hypothetical protein EET67_25115 [Pseudaminobacter arsenicus]|uniref:Uncharacterized protein n=1 Tax=Borborobacter arsenicus TaxID=1851146 RepID=A0A432UYZ3_9HYPH|nr:hypothetical protein EET67_25115 [Pseudaminobacter arsenicus]
MTISLIPFDTAASRNTDAAIVRRIRTLIDSAGLDCQCRDRLDDALARFAKLEHRRVQREHLARARQDRERIAAILTFLQDIDELAANESDPSVYMELALLFDEVIATADDGARSLRQLATLPQQR